MKSISTNNMHAYGTRFPENVALSDALAIAKVAGATERTFEVILEGKEPQE